jgi:hypothetical protein
MSYTYTNSQNTIITDGQGTFIPVDVNNAVYQRLIADNTPIGPYVAPPTPIPDLTARQFLSALTLQNIITEAEAMNRSVIPAAIAAVFDTLPPSYATVARITWANMTIVPRQDPLVDALGASMNMTPAQIDTFFMQASAI